MATFGKTDRGVTGGTNFPQSNVIVTACRFTLPDDNAVIAKMTAYSSTLGSSSSIKGVIYEVGGNNLPSSLIAQTGEASVGGGVNTFIDVVFASPPTLNSGDYFLGLIANGAFLTSSSNIGAGTLLNPVSGSTANPYPTVTSPFPSVVTLSPNQKTIYATYSVDTPSSGFTISLI